MVCFLGGFNEWPVSASTSSNIMYGLEKPLESPAGKCRPAITWKGEVTKQAHKIYREGYGSHTAWKSTVIKSGYRNISGVERLKYTQEPKYPYAMKMTIGKYNREKMSLKALHKDTLTTAVCKCVISGGGCARVTSVTLNSSLAWPCRIVEKINGQFENTYIEPITMK